MWLLANRARQKISITNCTPHNNVVIYCISSSSFPVFAQSWANLSHQLLTRDFAELLSSAHFAASASFSLFPPLWYQSKDMSARNAPHRGRADAPVRVYPCAYDDWWNLDRVSVGLHFSSTAFLLFGVEKASSQMLESSLRRLSAWGHSHCRPFFWSLWRMQWRKSNEPCYNGADYIMMIMNMQSRNRCKALFVQTSVRGQKDFWFISTSSDGAEELRCLWFVP